MKKQGILSAILAIFTAAFLLAAPGAAGEGTAKELFGIDPLPNQTHLRLGYFSGSIHGLANYVAYEKGWFKDANIEIEFVPFVNGPAMMEAKRSWDVGTTGAPGLISGIIGQDVKMIGLAYWDNILDLFVREDSPIFKSGKGHIPGYPEIWGKIDDWKGTQWLLPAGTTMHLVMLTTLERMGLKNEDVRINNMDANSAYTAFKAGQGDGMGVWTALAIQAKENGYKKVSGISECGARMATTIFSKQEALDKDRAAVKKYLEVYLAAAHWVDENRDEAAKYFLETCEEDGIATSPTIANAAVRSATTPTLKEQIEFVEKKVPDPKFSDKQITEMEKILIDTFDFFADQGRYEPPHRVKILSGFIDTSLLLELKADYEKAGKKIQ